MNRSAIERPTIESRGVILHCRKEEQTQRLESVTIQQHFVPFRQEWSFSRLLLAEWEDFTRADIQSDVTHMFRCELRGRGSRVTVPDYRQICGESIARTDGWMRSIDRVIDHRRWKIGVWRACTMKMKTSRSNGKWFRSIGREQRNRVTEI